MNQEECRKYLEKIQGLGIKLGLDPVIKLLSSLDNPQEKFPSVLVAGTNGKGSVCSMLSTILASHGFRAGLFTSPHLIHVEERIRVGEEMIPSGDFCRLLTRIRDKIEDLLDKKELPHHPTFFEILTSLAFLYFEEQRVDAAVLEVGMGGRLDATNVVTPLVSVITTVSRDHQKFLGSSLARIASEKAGIIKPNVPVVCGLKGGSAYRIIKRRAEELRVPFIGVFDGGGCFSVERNQGCFQFAFEFEGERYEFSPALPGEHQGRNAAVAITAASVLDRSWLRLDKRKIVRGIEETQWEGRLETVSRDPLVILDGAHNEEGAKALQAYVRDCLEGPVILIFAAMKDKEIRKIARRLFPLAGKVILTRFPYFRAADPEEIVSQAREFKDRIVIEPDPGQALAKARLAVPAGGSILVTGSIHLLGEVKKLLS